MRRVVLIGANFLREQRWFLILFLVWIFGSAALLRLAEDTRLDDLAFYLRQQQGYALAIAMFTAAGAIRNERRSRRILAVLSKGVSRAEYLGGLLAGNAALSLIYCACTGLATAVLATGFNVPLIGLATAIALLFVGALLVSAAALLFSTLLHPLLATVAAVALLLTQYAIEARLAPALLPVSGTARALIGFHFAQPAVLAPLAPLLASVEVVVLWWLAARLFARRDIAVAVE